MKKWYVSSLFILLILVACNGGGEGEGGSAITIKTGGIFTPISYKINNKEVEGTLDLGEYVNDSGPKVITIYVKNNTDYPMTNMDVEFVDQVTDAYGYEKDDEGVKAYPGASGNCPTTPAPNNSCTIALAFETSISGVYIQKIRFLYENLVEPDNRDATLQILAGTPASLIFNDGSTSYFSFGNLTGTAQIPVVERSEATLYTKNMTVKNGGELTARNITAAAIPSCTSAFDGTCPGGPGSDHLKVYNYTHNCPKFMSAGETCDVTVTYMPANQNPPGSPPGPIPPEIEEIRYDNTIMFSYGNDPDLTPAVLNGYFTSTSTIIEAEFETSIDNITFETAVIVGNRAQKTFKVNNVGYRDGIIKKLIFRDRNTTNIVAVCKGDADPDYPKCWNEAEDTLLTLAQFPFFLKDRDQCLKPDADPQTYIPIETGCIFDIYFQPSVTFLAGGTFELDLDVEYDSRWKGAETIKQNDLHDIDSEYLAAAKMVMEEFKINGVVITPDTIVGDIKTFQLNRLALQSPAFFERVAMDIKFKNYGEVDATATSYADGSGNNIPFNDADPDGVDIGPHSPKYYEDAIVSATTCKNIPPDGSCTIKIKFAPIGLATTAMEWENMFDVFPPTSDVNTGDPAQYYKRFFMDYDDGSLYSDTNLYTTTRDMPQMHAESQHLGTLVTKGYLKDYTKDPVNADVFDPASMTSENREYRYLTLFNIGTGPIPYINFTGECKDYSCLVGDIRDSSQWPDIASIYPIPLGAETPASHGVDYDCYDLIDMDYQDTDTMTEINARSANWGALPKEKKCVLKIKIEEMPEMRTVDYVTDPTFRANEQDQKMGDWGIDFRRGMTGIDAWQWRSFEINEFDLEFTYYDGDFSDPGVTAPYDLGATFGNEVIPPFEATAEDDVRADFKAPASIVVASPYPPTSAVLYRPGFTLPALVTPIVRPSEIFSEMWLWAQSNETVFDPLLDPVNKAYYAKDYVETTVLPGTNITSNEYFMHLGTFPVGGTYPASFQLAKLSPDGGNITDISQNVIDAGFTVTPSTALPFQMMESYPFVIPGSASNGYTVNLSFAPTIAGTFETEVSYTYEDGRFVDPEANPLLNPAQKTRTKTIKVVAEAIADAPDMSVDIYDFDVEPQDGAPPIETPNPVPAPMTLGFGGSAGGSISLSTIKVDSPGPNDVYVKKRIVFKNASTTKSIYNLSLEFRGSPLSASATDPSAAASIDIDATTCNTAINNRSAYLAGNGLPSLEPWDGAGPNYDQCEYVIVYQPRMTDVNQSYALTMTYEIAPKQYVVRSFNVNFQPKDPATVIPMGLSIKPISDENGDSLFSYPLGFGTISMTVDPQLIQFSNDAGPRPKVTMVNPTPTPASFLATYHEYLMEHDPFTEGWNAGNPPPLDRYPAPGDYISLGSEMVTPIYLTKYGGGDDRVEVLVTEPCLKGDDEAVPHFQKGFYDTSVNPCVFMFRLYADINYIGRQLNPVSPIDMDGNYLRIPFYNNDRSSKEWIAFHFEGKVNPNPSYKVGTDYTNVYATESREIGFDWSTMLVDNPDLGLISGYRVFQASSSVPLADPLSVASGFTDVVTTSFEVDVGLLRGKYYYFIVVPIRTYADYTFGKFTGLPAGQYLSLSDISVLEVVTPPLGMFYDHENFVLVSKDLNEIQLYDFPGAKASCSSNSALFLDKSGSFIAKTYKLIDSTIWDLIIADPANTVYGNRDQIAHWMDDPYYNIDSVLGADPAFDGAQASQLLNFSEAFYLRKNGCFSCTVPITKGGMTGNPAAEGYNSYVADDIVYAMPRCYISL
jgi:hypothetical protein